MRKTKASFSADMRRLRGRQKRFDDLVQELLSYDHTHEPLESIAEYVNYELYARGIVTVEPGVKYPWTRHGFNSYHTVTARFPMMRNGATSTRIRTQVVDLMLHQLAKQLVAKTARINEAEFQSHCERVGKKSIYHTVDGPARVFLLAGSGFALKVTVSGRVCGGPERPELEVLAAFETRNQDSLKLIRIEPISQVAAEEDTQPSALDSYLADNSAREHSAPPGPTGAKAVEPPLGDEGAAGVCPISKF